MNYKVTVVLLSIFLTGCATTVDAPQQAATVGAEKAELAEQPAAEKLSDEEAKVALRTESSKDSGDKLVCRRVQPTGSHRKKTICRKVSDIRKARSSAQEAMRGVQGPTVQPTPDGT